MWNVKNITNGFTCQKNREKKLVVTKGSRKGQSDELGICD